MHSIMTPDDPEGAGKGGACAVAGNGGLRSVYLRSVWFRPTSSETFSSDVCCAAVTLDVEAEGDREACGVM